MRNNTTVWELLPLNSENIGSVCKFNALPLKDTHTQTVDKQMLYITGFKRKLNYLKKKYVF